jgi:flagellar hook-length control protein FliK
MMQHVATAKSEVAAFATGAKSDSFKGSESNEQFGKLLQDQKLVHTLDGAPEAPTPLSARKQALQQSIDETKNVASSSLKEDTTKALDAQSSSSSQDNTAIQSATEGSTSKDGLTAVNVDDVSESVANSLKDGNTKEEWQLVSSSKEYDTEAAVESVSISAQEWVSLVDDLQKLTEIAHSTKQSLEDIDVENKDVSVADLILATKVEKGLLELAAKLQPIDNINATLDKSSLRQTGQLDEKKLNNEELVSFVTKEISQPSLAIYIQKILEKLTAEVETEHDSTRDIQQKTAESLLGQPDVLQNLLSANQEVESDSQVDLTSAENEALLRTLLVDVDIGTNPVKGSVNLAQPILPDSPDKLMQAQPVLPDSPDKLMQAQPVLPDSPDKLMQAQPVLPDSPDKLMQAQPVLPDSPDKLMQAQPILPDSPDKLMQAQQAQALLIKSESVAEQGELLEQDVQLAHVLPSNLVNSVKTEKLVSNNDINNILILPDNKLDKVLENIAQRVFDNKKAGEPINPEQIVQQVVVPKAAEIISTVELSSKDFISALKSGLEEFKNQLSQGREPGIDLKALVADALAKTTDTAIVAKAPINLEQMVNNVSQVLDLGQKINRAIEQHHDQVYSATMRDVAQIQGEQSKQVQLNQFESKFEKAINIAKPEGHLQLAEKVRWMVNTKNLIAEIRLDPAELGSVHVKVAMSGESATVNFVVQSQQARDAVDTATPRLREMLAEKGIELGQSSVRQESDGQQEQGEDVKQGERGNDESEDIDVSEQVLAQHNIVNGALGGIDYFV